MTSFPSPEKWLRWILILACIALFLYHGYIVQKYAVNIPYFDDWAFFAGDDHPRSLSWSWLQQQHNEHRMALTRILIWLQFRLNGWNYPFSLLINFLIYGGLLSCLIWFIRNTRTIPFWTILAFTIFLLSPINWFNHFMAIQSAFHLYVVLLFLSCGFLFGERQTFRNLLVGAFTAALCVYTIASGFVSVLVLLIAFCGFKLARIARAEGRTRSRELLQLAIVAAPVASTLVLWCIGFTKPAHHPTIVYPYQIQFWTFFANLVSVGFGYMRIYTSVGVLCNLIVMIPIIGEIWRQRLEPSRINWAPYVVVMAILANVASISAGRAGFGIEMAKNDRYFEFVMPLMLLSAVNWAIFLKRKERLRTAALLALWLFCSLGFSRKWDFINYSRSRQDRLIGVECVRAYYEGQGDGRCDTLLPFSMVPFLEQGRRLNASFYRELSSGQR